MHLWGAADLIREFRYFWPAGDCTGLGLGTTLLLVLVSWISGLITGVILAALCLSQSCRKILLLLLQSCINVLAPSAPGTFSRAVQLRSRLSEYKHS
jgi:hypothetical protein